MNRYASVAVAKGKVLREFGDEITIEASFKILNADPRKSLDDLYCGAYRERRTRSLHRRRISVVNTSSLW
ncbi:MAG: hypothetical protein GX338_11980 [Firmicutes bacterium]|jgi:hypothetical protein|nr:hypothetical protein [Bacillota bacterium]